MLKLSKAKEGHSFLYITSTINMQSLETGAMLVQMKKLYCKIAKRFCKPAKRYSNISKRYSNSAKRNSKIVLSDTVIVQSDTLILVIDTLILLIDSLILLIDTLSDILIVLTDTLMVLLLSNTLIVLSRQINSRHHLTSIESPSDKHRTTINGPVILTMRAAPCSRTECDYAIETVDRYRRY